MGKIGSVGAGDGVSMAGTRVDVGNGVDGKVTVGSLVSVGAGVVAGVQAANNMTTRNTTSSAFFMTNPFVFVF